MIHELTTERVPVAELRTYHRNPRQGDTAAIAGSLRVNGQYRPLVANRGTHTGRHSEVLAGNHTLAAARDLGWDEIAVAWVDVDDDQAVRIVAADNRTADLGGYDDRLLAELLGGLDTLDGTGYDDTDLDDILARLQDGGDEGAEGDDGADDDEDEEDRPSLADRFLIPPFDVLDARQGWWRTRKRSWIALGLRSETGRDAFYVDGKPTGGKGLLYGSMSGADPDFYRKKEKAERDLGRTFGAAEFEASEHYTPPPSAAVNSGTSVFCPVLCELAYRWFSPADGAVLDPFAGGSVRGLMAAMLGRTYRGNDLSERQIESNREQADDFAARGLVDQAPVWSVGDSAAWVRDLEPDSADLIFTCPPYLWLERYDKDNPNDLSNMDADAFEDVYAGILTGAARALRPDRYAVIVVGDVRDTKGRLHDFRAMTVRAAAQAGLTLHNAAVLVTAAGSLAGRSARAFEAARTLGRTHQDVLVFVKGDRKRAADACGAVDVALPDDIQAAFDEAPATDGDGDVIDTPPVPADYLPDITPVETHAGVLVKRDDAWSYRGASGAKARTMHRLATERGSTGIITAGARRSPQIERAALVAQALGIRCRVHVPAGADTDETRTCERAGADVIRHKAGRLSVLRARFRTDTEAPEHTDWLHVPFGMGMDAYLDDVATQAAHLPDIPGRLVVPCGSGHTLAGILRGLPPEHTDTDIVAVQVGHDPADTLDQHAPGWRDRVHIVEAPEAFDDDAPRTRLGQLPLDPMYEAKCLPHLHEGDLLWCVGRRTNAT